MKSRNFFKKGIIWTLVLSMLFGTVAMTAVTTAVDVGGETVFDSLDTAISRAAEYRILREIMGRCVSVFSVLHLTENVDERGELFTTDAFWPQSVYNAYIGAYGQSLFDKKVSYDEYTGILNCEVNDSDEINPIVEAFRKTIEVPFVGDADTPGILCNGSKPGLVRVKEKEFDDNLDCQAVINSNNDDYEFGYNDSFNGTYEGKNYKNGDEYITLLYEHWLESKKNTPEYKYLLEPINSSESAIKYKIAQQDFEIGCAGTVDTGDSSSSDYLYVDIDTVSVDGGISKVLYRFSNKARKQYTAYSDEKMDCKAIAGVMNISASAYATAIQDGLKNECKAKGTGPWIIAHTIATSIDKGKTYNFNYGGETYANGDADNPYDYSDSDKNWAKGILQQYKNMNLSNQDRAVYYKQDDTNAVSCLLPEGWEAVIDTPTTLPDTNITGTAIDSCQSNAGALGWVICNVLELAGSAAESAYESFLKPQLEVNPVLIGATGNESTASAWSKFQGFANIAFAIVFLIIIFSQLTGYGIDNYGIKKILPKLIVTVILVNLSFVICQVAVDLSNILGNSLQNLFSSIRVDATLTETFEGTTDTFQISAGTQTLLWAVLVGVLVGGGIAIWRNPALLISLLVSVLGVLIAGFFVFILLAARQAAIVVLIVLSPLAFVCYALPNTKKLFDKWLKLMQSLLLVYPICGLLIGGGDFASRLLLSAGLGTSFAAGLTAMLVGIVPIFFIPTVLKNSMSALGGLGAKILERGNKISGGAKSTLRNTRAYKNAQERGKARGDRRFAQARAGIRFDKDGKVVESRNPIARLRRRTADTVVGRFFGTGAAMGEQQAKLRGMEEKRQQNTMTAEVGVAPLVNASNLRQKMQNAINEAVAENEVPVVPVDVELAIQRRKSANEAQELKNYKDQFAEYSKAQLEEEAGRAGDWLSKDGGTQRMQALLSAMESQGMQKSMAGVLEKHGDVIGNNAKIMQTLAGSKDKVFKAYGKAGAGQSYKQFMSGTGNGKSLAEYVKEKDVDFLDGLDDKALAQIRKYQTSNNDIMSGSMLAQAAAKINSQDATDEIDEMIRSKIESGEKVEFSAAQYANLNTSTQEMLDSLHRSGNSSVGDNLIRISNDMINAPEQYAKLNFNEKDANGNGVNGSGTYLNEARARAGLGTMQDAIQSLHVPHSS